MATARRPLVEISHLKILSCEQQIHLQVFAHFRRGAFGQVGQQYAAGGRIRDDAIRGDHLITRRLQGFLPSLVEHDWRAWLFRPVHSRDDRHTNRGTLQIVVSRMVFSQGWRAGKKPAKRDAQGQNGSKRVSFHCSAF